MLWDQIHNVFDKVLLICKKLRQLNSRNSNERKKLHRGLFQTYFINSLLLEKLLTQIIGE